jgi:hypothetical protein
MNKSEEEQKTGVEGWIDEQIQLALSGLAHPFEKRIARLRRRVQKLHARIHRLSSEIDEDPTKGQGAEKQTEEEEL